MKAQGFAHALTVELVPLQSDVAKTHHEAIEPRAKVDHQASRTQHELVELLAHLVPPTGETAAERTSQIANAGLEVGTGLDRATDEPWDLLARSPAIAPLRVQHRHGLPDDELGKRDASAARLLGNLVVEAEPEIGERRWIGYDRPS